MPGASREGRKGEAALLDRIDEVAARRGDEPALAVVDHRGDASVLSWKAFDGEVRLLAAAIAARIGPGTAVLVPAECTLEGLVRLVAVLASGRTAVPLDPSSPEEGLRAFAAEIERTGLRTAPWDADATAPPHLVDDPLCVLATGGSTGRAKPVQWPRDRFDPFADPAAILQHTGWQPGQTQLAPGPLHHAAPFARLLDGVAGGNTMVVPRVFRPEAVLEAMARFAVEWTQLTPSHMRALDPVIADRSDATRSLRGVLHTAAPCPPDTKRHWIRLLGGKRVHEMYTATESIGATLCDGDEWLARPGTVGRGFFTRIRVLAEDGTVLDPGEIGEVHMRGLAAGARGDRGYGTVGDLGRLDADGYLYLTGRRQDLLNVGGEKVSATDVAATLMSHPDIADAVVVGVPDDRFGTRVRACVVPRPGTRPTARDVIDHCLGLLSPYQVPTLVQFLDALPRKESGKLDRAALTEETP